MATTPSSDVPPVTVRSADRSDLQELVALCEKFCVIDGHEFNESLVAGAFTELLQTPARGLVLVAESSLALMGYAVVTWGFSIESGGVDALLDELYVDRRRTGLGSALMEVVIDVAHRGGASRIFLETENRNQSARDFYRHHGFAIEDSVWMSRSL